MGQLAEHVGYHLLRNEIPRKDGNVMKDDPSGVVKDAASAFLLFDVQ